MKHQLNIAIFPLCLALIATCFLGGCAETMDPESKEPAGAEAGLSVCPQTAGREIECPNYTVRALDEEDDDAAWLHVDFELAELEIVPKNLRPRSSGASEAPELCEALCQTLNDGVEYVSPVESLCFDDCVRQLYGGFPAEPMSTYVEREDIPVSIER